ncbi:hypothetical protein ElyMa_001346700 [Elysia marginata]|uniref:Uncharacterized protein n=1 Tax=Elysia marginata TaxID=1093978 RepID=A0AAV4INI0_9GAST|nr:hypothetical protein ElyMa_001346700 [Elysia marginata]
MIRKRLTPCTVVSLVLTPSPFRRARWALHGYNFYIKDLSAARARARIKNTKWVLEPFYTLGEIEPKPRDKLRHLGGAGQALHAGLYRHRLLEKPGYSICESVLENNRMPYVAQRFEILYSIYVAINNDSNRALDCTQMCACVAIPL